MEVAR